MNMKKAIFTLALGAALVACAPHDRAVVQDKASSGYVLGTYSIKQTEPDKHGVVCYHLVYTDTLSCVKVQ